MEQTNIRHIPIALAIEGCKVHRNTSSTSSTRTRRIGWRSAITSTINKKKLIGRIAPVKRQGPCGEPAEPLLTKEKKECIGRRAPVTRINKANEMQRGKAYCKRQSRQKTRE